jgi:hypothetical protein
MCLHVYITHILISFILKAQIEKAGLGMSKLMKDCIEDPEALHSLSLSLSLSIHDTYIP